MSQKHKKKHHGGASGAKEDGGVTLRLGFDLATVTFRGPPGTNVWAPQLELGREVGAAAARRGHDGAHEDPDRPRRGPRRN